jgi:hypothetical protein
LIDFGSTVVVIHTQLAVFVVTIFGTLDSTSVNRPSSVKSSHTSCPSISESV